MRRALVVAALAQLAGCESYAARTMHSAPGVADLSTPMARENGDPALAEPPRDPGFSTLAVFVAPYIGGGVGRTSSSEGRGETGVELRFERAQNALLAPRAFALTAGFAPAQWGGSHAAEVGPLFALLSYRFLASSWPVDIGAGPAVYAKDPEVGAQVSIHVSGLVFTHVRYFPRSGWEAISGVVIPVPFFFERSR